MKVYHGGIEEIRFPLVKVGEKALGELAKHRPNNQMCLLNQTLIGECLHFVNVEPVKFE